MRFLLSMMLHGLRTVPDNQATARDLRHFTASRLLPLIGAVALAGCGDPYPDYHYKMTVYVETPDGEMAYSSVRSVEVSETASVVDSPGYRQTAEVEGEAVIIDHPNGRTYYALLSRPDDLDYARFVPGYALARHIRADEPQSEKEQVLAEAEYISNYDPSAAGERSAERYRRMIEIEGPRLLPRTIPNHDKHRGPREIQTWPVFATFGNEAQPATVRDVSPESIRVTRITVEITDEDVTEQIATRLPWLEEYYDRMLDGKRLNDGRSFANNLSTGAFWSGK